MSYYKDPETGNVFHDSQLRRKTLNKYIRLTDEETSASNIARIEMHLGRISKRTEDIFYILAIPLIIGVIIGAFYIATSSM